jgi:hypothetical protein
LQVATTFITPVLFEQVKAGRRLLVSYARAVFVNSLQVMSCAESCWQVSQSQIIRTSIRLACLFIPLILPDLCPKSALLSSSLSFAGLAVRYEDCLFEHLTLRCFTAETAFCREQMLPT